jgi:hypothetical protein
MKGDKVCVLRRKDGNLNQSKMKKKLKIKRKEAENLNKESIFSL